MILQFLDRRFVAYFNCALNLVDVRDVAAGHLPAAERGRVGDRYILGNANLMMREILAILEELTGVPAPRLIDAGLVASRVRRTPPRAHPGTQPRLGLAGARELSTPGNRQ